MLFKLVVFRAYSDYSAAIKKGDDGRPNWEARKSCNFVTAAIEDCSNLFKACYSEDDVNALKDQQFANVVNQLESIMEGWDSDKCPPIK